MTLYYLVGGYKAFGGTSSHHTQSQRFFQYVDAHLIDKAMSISRTKHPKLNWHAATNLEINCTRTDVCCTHIKQLMFSGETLKINVQNSISSEY